MHETALALVPLIAPVGLAAAAAVGFLDRGAQPRLAIAGTILATRLSLAVAAVSAALLVSAGPGTSPLLGAEGFGLSVRLDAVSVTMLSLIAFVGAVVARFSRNYLAGDARHGLFMGRLSATLAAVMTLVIAGNLVHLAAAWIATSLTLHHLLVFYRERPRARIAARKKFWVARLGDVFLVAAAALLVAGFGTTDIATLADAARAGARPEGLSAAAVLLGVAAALKSAQFPTHGWLTEVMETPTPVSALLHAGIINAGGFLVVRLADVVVTSHAALLLLAVLGGLSALYGSAVMLTQGAVKTALAYSTVAQMGFMLFECGIGAFSIAMLHIVAHSLYKAHAFLSSGSAVDAAAHAAPAAEPSLVQRWVLAAGSLVVVATLAAMFWLGSQPDAVIAGLGAIVVVGATHLVARMLAPGMDAAALPRAIGSGALVLAAYLVLERTVQWLYTPALPSIPAPDPATLALLVATIAGFALLAAGQWLLPTHGRHPAVRAAYVHLRHGLYANVLFDRLVGAAKQPTQTASNLATETQS